MSLALGTPLAGCGGSDEADAYVDAVNQTQKRFAKRIDQLSRDIPSTSTPAKDRRTLVAFKRAADRAVSELRRIDVPAEVTTEHRQLVDGIADYGMQIDSARSAIASNDPRRLLAAQTELVSAVTAVGARINRAIEAINRKLGG